MKKEYEVIIDLGSKTFRINAESKEEAGEKAYEKFAKNPEIQEFWVGDVSEVEQ